MIIETHYNETLNEMMNPNNNKLFYSTQFKEFITIILHPCGFMEDQPGKRQHANHAGGNSEYGGVWGHSCNVKDMFNKLVSCDECENLMRMGEDSDGYTKCLN